VTLLDADWPAFVVVDVDEALIRDAAQLIDRYAAHALRAFDAIHLASALIFAGGRPPSRSPAGTCACGGRPAMRDSRCSPPWSPSDAVST
jgi:hypothetical protein